MKNPKERTQLFEEISRYIYKDLYFHHSRSKLLCTVNREMFVYENIHVLNVCVKKFRGAPMKIFEHENFVWLEIRVLLINRLL